MGDGVLVAEDGSIASDTYTVVLGSQPRGDVTVGLAPVFDPVIADSQVDAVDNANPGNDFLVFTPGDWNLPQTVTLAPALDALGGGWRLVEESTFGEFYLLAYLEQRMQRQSSP